MITGSPRLVLPVIAMNRFFGTVISGWNHWKSVLLQISNYIDQQVGEGLKFSIWVLSFETTALTTAVYNNFIPVFFSRPVPFPSLNNKFPTFQRLKPKMKIHVIVSDISSVMPCECHTHVALEGSLNAPLHYQSHHYMFCSYVGEARSRAIQHALHVFTAYFLKTSFLHSYPPPSAYMPTFFPLTSSIF